MHSVKASVQPLPYIMASEFPKSLTFSQKSDQEAANQLSLPIISQSLVTIHCHQGSTTESQQSHRLWLLLTFKIH